MIGPWQRQNCRITIRLQETYGRKGNVSVPPPIILKMMLLLVLYNVRSERELMNTIPLRIDWMWFLCYDLDDEIPNHSVLSKEQMVRYYGYYSNVSRGRR